MRIDTDAAGQGEAHGSCREQLTNIDTIHKNSTSCVRLIHTGMCLKSYAEPSVPITGLCLDCISTARNLAVLHPHCSTACESHGNGVTSRIHTIPLRGMSSEDCVSPVAAFGIGGPHLAISDTGEAHAVAKRVLMASGK